MTENFANGEINERSFSNPHPWSFEYCQGSCIKIDINFHQLWDKTVALIGWFHTIGGQCICYHSFSGVSRWISRKNREWELTTSKVYNQLWWAEYDNQHFNITRIYFLNKTEKKT